MRYFGGSGVGRCGRCLKVGRGRYGCPYECAAAKGHVNDCEYFEASGKEKGENESNGCVPSTVLNDFEVSFA